MPTIIENFESTEVSDFYSYPGQDNGVMPDGFEIVHCGGGWNHPTTGGVLQLTDNLWKVLNITPVQTNKRTTWTLKYMQHELESGEFTRRSEIIGFGVAVINPDGSLGDKLKYALHGYQNLEDDWEWSLQGFQRAELGHTGGLYDDACSAFSWPTTTLEIGKDFYRKYGYYPEISAIFFINDCDSCDHTQGTFAEDAWFYDIQDITDTIQTPHNVTLRYRTEAVTGIENNTPQLLVNFSSFVNGVDDGQELLRQWDFGDGETLEETNQSTASHIYEVGRGQKYVCTLKVFNPVTQLWSWTSVDIRQSNLQQVNPAINKFKMVFTGDVMMSRRFECYDYPTCDEPGLLQLYGSDYLFQPTSAMLNEADLKFVNLETVVSDSNGIEQNAHPTKSILLLADTSILDSFVNFGIDKVSLANNHTSDYMERGMIDTINALDSRNIKHSGAGTRRYLAESPENINFRGTNIGFIAVSDRHGQYNNNQPFLNSYGTRWGFANAHEYDIGLTLDSLIGFTDLNIIELHAGGEYSTTPMGRSEGEYEDEPSNILRTEDLEFRRNLADNDDVNLIVTHHPHIIQGVEWYNNTLIVHSLGNFIFDSNFPETFPSMLFYPTIQNKKFTKFEFKPVYIDHYLTIPALGELGLSILNYVANLSKDLNTTLSVNRYTNTAEVIKNPDREPKIKYKCLHELKNGILVYDESVNRVMYQYDLIRTPNIGNLGGISALSLSNSTRYRVGREKVWFGNMENEGANMWLLNSEDEYYVESDFYRGTRSLQQNRAASNSSSILTTIEKRLPLHLRNLNYSIHAAIKTINAPQSTLEIVYYSDRYGEVIGQQSLSIYPVGTTGWKIYDEELNIPNQAQFFNLRLKSWPPTMGTSQVYWDDVGLIEWDDWVDVELTDRPTLITNPNDYTYIQIRTDNNLSGQELAFLEIFYGKRVDDTDLLSQTQCTPLGQLPTNPQIPT